jgi:DNA-binding NarL/FixJ family response regulator
VVVVQIGGISAHLRTEQLQVIDLVARGYTYKDIGRELSLSKRGVQKRMEALCAAIGARNRVEALMILLREGIII